MNPYAYFTVVLIWGTTPLSIQWSAEGASPFIAALMRMSLAAIVMMALLPALGLRLPFHRQTIRLYVISTLGQGVAMILIYWSSSYLSSSFISLMFGLSPLVTGVLAWSMYRKTLSPIQISAIFLGFVGLVIVLFDNLEMDTQNLQGSLIGSNTFKAVLCGLLATVLFCLSNILIKRYSKNVDIHPFALAMGSTLFALPWYILCYLMGDMSVLEANFTTQAKLTLVYLSLFGSIIAPYCFYTVLKSSSESLVALITVASPVVALVLGALLNNEALTFIMLLGSSLVIASLLLFQFEKNTLERVSRFFRS